MMSRKPFYQGNIPVYQTPSQELYTFLTFPSHLQNHCWLFSCYAPTAMGNTQGLSELFNRLIAIAGSCKVLILMKVTNIFNVHVYSNQSSPFHCNIYTPFFCRIPCFRETKETSLVLCILCSMSLSIQKLTNFEDQRTELVTALRCPFSSIF